MRVRPGLILLILSLSLIACGGGGGGGGDPTPEDPVPPDAPDVALLLVSGHEGLFDGSPSRSYLHEELGPALVNDLLAAGFTVEVFYFVDHHATTDYPGYPGLTDRLATIRDDWAPDRPEGTRVVVVSHSHGGVWATAAVRQVGDVPIAAHIALDHSSLAWGIVGHDTTLIGGDPESALEIPALAGCPAYPGVPSEQDFFYDLEDVVMPSVIAALEVRSAEGIFDERWNVRADGTVAGLTCYYSGESHSEARETTGSTYPFVIGWLLDQL